MNLRHDNPTLPLDVIICHVSDISFVFIVRGEAKEPHDVYFHNPIPMDQGQQLISGILNFSNIPTVARRKIEVRSCLVVSQR